MMVLYVKPEYSETAEIFILHRAFLCISDEKGNWKVDRNPDTIDRYFNKLASIAYEPVTRETGKPGLRFNTSKLEGKGIYRVSLPRTDEEAKRIVRSLRRSSERSPVTTPDLERLIEKLNEMLEKRRK